jgi:site-specific DNA-methyltransferase (adenine-specific)
MKLNKYLEITNEDNMVLMSRYPDKYFDLAIVDPEYGINADIKNNNNNKQSKKSATMSKKYGNQKWDNKIPSEDYFKEVLRISKHQIIWGINYFKYNLFGSGRIFWDKEVTMPTYSSGEIAYCSKINSVKYFKYRWHGMIQGNMKKKQIRIHPTEKPIQLYEWLLKTYAKPNDKILDTHFGSGSHGIAIHKVNIYDKMNLSLVACELDKQYYDDSIKRIKLEIREQSLF